MKFFISLIFGCILSFNLLAKIVTIDIFFVADATNNKVMEFGDILTYRQTEGSAVDRAIGQSEILDGTGFWKDFVGFTCTYAIEYVDDVVFVPGKCKK